jgi:hypothetical protein
MDQEISELFVDARTDRPSRVLLFFQESARYDYVGVNCPEWKT